MLQWGRDHVIAEIRRDAWKLEHKSMLQWGRDHVIAEITRLFLILHPLSGFNGAAIT